MAEIYFDKYKREEMKLVACLAEAYFEKYKREEMALEYLLGRALRQGRG